MADDHVITPKPLNMKVGTNNGSGKPKPVKTNDKDGKRKRGLHS